METLGISNASFNINICQLDRNSTSIENRWVELANFALVFSNRPSRQAWVEFPDLQRAADIPIGCFKIYYDQLLVVHRCPNCSFHFIPFRALFYLSQDATSVGLGCRFLSDSFRLLCTCTRRGNDDSFQLDAVLLDMLVWKRQFWSCSRSLLCEEAGKGSWIQFIQRSVCIVSV